MSIVETFHQPQNVTHFLQGYAAHVLGAISAANLSFRDTAQATDRMAQALEEVSQPLILDTAVIPATASLGPRFLHRAIVRRGHHNHGLLISSPALDAYPDQPQTMLIGHGMTHRPDGGNGQALHFTVADQYPEAQVVSLCNEGDGLDESPMTIRESAGRSFRAMGSTALSITARLAGDDPVRCISYSRGTVQHTHMLHQNLQSKKLQVSDATMIASALVPPDTARHVFGNDFLPYFYNGVEKPQQRSRFQTALACARAVRHVQPVYIGTALQLAKGTDIHIINEIAAAGTRMRFIYGDQDPLAWAQADMYDQLAGTYPGTVQLIPKVGRGHSITEFIDDLPTDLSSAAACTASATDNNVNIVGSYDSVIKSTSIIY